jgi:hypothetical protein
LLFAEKLFFSPLLRIANAPPYSAGATIACEYIIKPAWVNHSSRFVTVFPGLL